MSQRRVKAGDVFEQFLIEHHEEDLIKILEVQDEKLHLSVVINFLTLFQEHMEVAEAILASPQRLIRVFENSLVKALLATYKKKLNRDVKFSLKTNVHIRLTEIPSCPELHLDSIPHTYHVGQLLCLSGTITRVTSPKIMEIQREYICAKCKHTFVVKAHYSLYYQISRPYICPNPQGQCFSSSFLLLESSCKYSRDYQEIKLQEQAQKLVVGRIPRSIWITLEDDLVDTIKPGDDVLVCGQVLQRWKSLIRGVRPEIDLVIKSNNVIVRNKQRAGMMVTNEMKVKFQNFWDQYKYDPLEGRNVILTSFCPQIYGLYIIKLAMAIVICGGVQRIDDNGTKTRGESHLLLVGDPGTAKSQFLKYASTVVPRSVLTTGIGTSSAGLTVTAVRDEGEWALEAGALVLADGGICCIDEFNCVKQTDRGAIHEAMEQQTISVAKAGLVCKLNSRCSILAATNPKGNYDKDQPLNVNVALASPLLSRFDLIFILLDSRNADWDEIVSTFILEGRNPQSLTEQDDQWSIENLRNYFSHSRTIHPQMSPSAHSILTKYYQLQRQNDGRSQARTTIRMLESLIRISQGHARLCMSMEVRTLDAIVAISLMEASMSGTALLHIGNPLHSAFPVKPRDDYKRQLELILRKMSLDDVLESEFERLSAEDGLLRQDEVSKKNPALGYFYEVKARNASDILKFARTQSLKLGFSNVLELGDNFELDDKLTGKKGKIDKYFVSINSSIGKTIDKENIEDLGKQDFKRNLLQRKDSNFSSSTQIDRREESGLAKDYDINIFDMSLEEFSQNLDLDILEKPTVSRVKKNKFVPDFIKNRKKKLKQTVYNIDNSSNFLNEFGSAIDGENLSKISKNISPSTNLEECDAAATTSKSIEIYEKNKSPPLNLALDLKKFSFNKQSKILSHNSKGSNSSKSSEIYAQDITFNSKDISVNSSNSEVNNRTNCLGETSASAKLPANCGSLGQTCNTQSVCTLSARDKLKAFKHKRKVNDIVSNLDLSLPIDSISGTDLSSKNIPDTLVASIISIPENNLIRSKSNDKFTNCIASLQIENHKLKSKLKINVEEGMVQTNPILKPKNLFNKPFPPKSNQIYNEKQNLENSFKDLDFDFEF